jgi:MoaA/NifB/PqqE/SkfB family radical SAM enzyme
VSSDHTDRLFCSKPFTWFEVSRGKREGEVFLCCPSWLDTPVGNLDEQSVAEVWNGAAAQEIRRSILDGSFSYCNGDRCPYLQTVSGPVQYRRDVTDPLMRAVLDDELVVLPYGPRDINCAYDRSCNLSCPSCRTGIIVETQRRAQIERIQAKIDGEALRDAELLYITGSGDPFGSPFFRRWLRTMERARMPRLQRLYLHTNAILWTPEMWASIPAEIRELVHSTEISIDAAREETYAINRRGATFATLLRNLEFISGLRRAGPLRYLCIHMVVQRNNYREMPEFVELGRRFGADCVYFSRLVNWGTFSPEEYAERAVHVREHPLHDDFRRIVGDSRFDDPIVNFGNLTSLAPSGAPREGSAAGF